MADEETIEEKTEASAEENAEEERKEELHEAEDSKKDEAEEEATEKEEAEPEKEEAKEEKEEATESKDSELSAKLKEPKEEAETKEATETKDSEPSATKPKKQKKKKAQKEEPKPEEDEFVAMMRQEEEEKKAEAEARGEEEPVPVKQEVEEEISLVKKKPAKKKKKKEEEFSEETVEGPAEPKIFALRTTANREDQVMSFVTSNAARKKLEVYSVIRPHGMRGYIFVEAGSRADAEQAAFGVPYARGLLDSTIHYNEIEHMLEQVKKEANIQKNDIAEIISGPFKREKCKITRIDKTKEEVVVELLEAAVPIPLTLKMDAVRVIRRDESGRAQEEE